MASGIIPCFHEQQLYRLFWRAALVFADPVVFYQDTSNLGNGRSRYAGGSRLGP
jgi:hypothetical protein